MENFGLPNVHEMLTAARQSIAALEEQLDMIPPPGAWGGISAAVLETLFRRKEEATYFARQSFLALREALRELEKAGEQLRARLCASNPGDPEREQLDILLRRQMRFRNALSFELGQVQQALEEADQKRHPSVPPFHPREHRGQGDHAGAS